MYLEGGSTSSVWRLQHNESEGRFLNKKTVNSLTAADSIKLQQSFVSRHWSEFGTLQACRICSELKLALKSALQRPPPNGFKGLPSQQLRRRARLGSSQFRVARSASEPQRSEQLADLPNRYLITAHKSLLSHSQAFKLLPSSS